MRLLLCVLCVLSLPLAVYAGDPPAPPPPSESEDGALAWDDAAPALVCEDPQRFWPGSCRGTFTLTVQAKRAMRPLRAVLTEASSPDAQVLYEYEPVTLAPGQRWQVPRSPTLQRAGRWLLVLTYADAAGVERQLAAQVVVTNPARGAAEQACGVCSGEFKRWGLRGLEWCNCRPADAGKPCQDGRECEGTCLAVKPKTPSDAPGQCSALKTMFGCHTRIEHDPTHPAGRRTTTICAD